MQMTIVPHVGVGPLKFGMEREEVRKLFSSSPKVLEHKTSLDGIPFDSFALPDTIRCVQCEYRKQNILQQVILFQEADPIFRGKHVLRMAFADLIDWLKTIDPNGKEKDFILFREIGIALGKPVNPDKETASNIGIFEQGYW